MYPYKALYPKEEKLRLRRDPLLLGPKPDITWKPQFRPLPRKHNTLGFWFRALGFQALGWGVGFRVWGFGVSGVENCYYKLT